VSSDPEYVILWLDHKRMLPMTIHHARLGSDGSVTIPAELREALGLKPGDSVDLEVKNRQLIVSPPKLTIEEIQAVVARHYAAIGGEHRSLADELIAERRRESDRE
jgi:AbrB family looped-hinge helix DNA binding protein